MKKDLHRFALAALVGTLAIITGCDSGHSNGNMNGNQNGYSQNGQSQMNDQKTHRQMMEDQAKKGTPKPESDEIHSYGEQSTGATKGSFGCGGGCGCGCGCGS